jgi:hypothetical protein
MSRVSVCAFSILAAGAALALPAYGQAVISTRAGLVHFFEGAVFVAGQPLQARLGKFTTIPEGAELRTEQGRAEVLLTPGVFLRLGEKSAIRMVANALADTRVELLSGSAIVESAQPAAGTSVTLIYKDWSVHQPEKGAYRIDGQPPRVQVREGEAEVSDGAGDPPVSVDQGMDLPLAAVLVPEKSTADAHDSLSDWAEGRAESISADNAISASIQDPATLSGSNLPADAFTYFPMLGYSSFGSLLSSASGSLSSSPSGLYGSLYQTGFYSLYLPGYTYRPLFLRMPSSLGSSIGLQRPLYPPARIGFPSSPVTHSPTIRPITPQPVHVGVHPIGRR